MSDFRISGRRGKTIRWQIAATKTLADGTAQPIDLTLAGTKIRVTGRLHPDDASNVFAKDYFAGGGAPDGGVTVPAPGQAATNVAEILIPWNEPGMIALTRSRYILTDVELTEPDGTVTEIATGVLKVRYWAIPAQPPTVTAFAPAAGHVGDTITLMGTGFLGATSVELNGDVAAFTVVSDTEIDAVVPEGAATGQWRVATPGGSFVDQNNFTFLTSIPEFAIISRGLPLYASHDEGAGNFAAANAIDGDYGSTWRSITAPSEAAPHWLALDLRGVTPAEKSKLWFAWKNPMSVYFQPTAPLGEGANSFILNPRNYKLQAHASSGALPDAEDAGWTDLVSVVDNRYSQRVHTEKDGDPTLTGLNLTGYDWFRIRFTAGSGPIGNDDIRVQIELRDARGSTQDSIFVYGNSHAADGLNDLRPDGAHWIVGPIENLLQDATGRDAPMLINGAIPGWDSVQANANKIAYIGASPCAYVLMHIGSADVNNANIDLGPSGGVNSPFAQSFKNDLQIVIDYIASLGKKCILPNIPWQQINSFSAGNVVILNAIIAQLIAANPAVVVGADEYTTYNLHHELISADNLHPSWDNADASHMYLGMTGYEWLQTLTRDNLVAALYT